MASPQEIANAFSAAAEAKAQGKKPIQHIEMDPAVITGKTFCPTCGNRMPQQGLPEPYPIKDIENK